MDAKEWLGSLAVRRQSVADRELVEEAEGIIRGLVDRMGMLAEIPGEMVERLKAELGKPSTVEMLTKPQVVVERTAE